MKFRLWLSLIFSGLMLIFSGYLLADSSVMSLDLLSNPNLNVALELIRLFWGIVGLIYFLYYFYKAVDKLRFNPPTTNSRSKSSHPKRPRKRKRRKKRQRRKSSRKAKKSK